MICPPQTHMHTTISKKKNLPQKAPMYQQLHFVLKYDQQQLKYVSFFFFFFSSCSCSSFFSPHGSITCCSNDVTQLIIVKKKKK